MAKFASDAVLDGLLDKVATGTILTVCSAQPTNRTEAVTTYKIADATIDASDFTKAAGDISGRKIIIAQQDNLDVDATQTANHVAICDDTNLLYVTTCAPQLLTSGNKVTTPAWAIEVTNPL